MIDHTTLTIVGVYRPPSGSNLDFLGEFTEWLTDNLMLPPNTVITWGTSTCTLTIQMMMMAANCKDAMVAPGLRQHILFPTHKSGNTLDLIFMEEYSNIEVRICRKGNFISDHYLITCTTILTKPDITHQLVNYRNPKDIDAVLISADIKLDYYEDTPPSDLVHQFDTSLREALDNMLTFNLYLYPKGDVCHGLLQM